MKRLNCILEGQLQIQSNCAICVDSIKFTSSHVIRCSDKNSFLNICTSCSKQLKASSYCPLCEDEHQLKLKKSNLPIRSVKNIKRLLFISEIVEEKFRILSVITDSISHLDPESCSNDRALCSRIKRVLDSIFRSDLTSE